MRKLIVLAGLPIIEKMTLAVSLANALHQRGQTVTVLDNIARIPLDASQLNPATTVMRVTVDLTQYLNTTLANVQTDTVILALSENAHPEALFDALDCVKGYQTRLFALIDERTIDCFPQLRHLLEAHADVSFHLPVTTETLLKAI